jgi:hypothetical protein
VVQSITSDAKLYLLKKVGSYGQMEDKQSISISLSKEGKIDPLLSDFHNLRSLMVHEDKHREDGKMQITYSEYIGVYFHQFEEGSFKHTSQDFKEEMIGNVQYYIDQINIFKNGGFDKYNKSTSDFRKS